MKTLHQILKELQEEEFPVTHTIEHKHEEREIVQITIPTNRAIWDNHFNEILKVGGFKTFYITNSSVEDEEEPNLSRIVFIRHPISS